MPWFVPEVPEQDYKKTMRISESRCPLKVAHETGFSKFHQVTETQKIEECKQNKIKLSMAANCFPHIGKLSAYNGTAN